MKLIWRNVPPPSPEDIGYLNVRGVFDGPMFGTCLYVPNAVIVAGSKFGAYRWSLYPDHTLFNSWITRDGFQTIEIAQESADAEWYAAWSLIMRQFKARAAEFRLQYDVGGTMDKVEPDPPLFT